MESACFPDFGQKWNKSALLGHFLDTLEKKKSIQQPLSIHIKVPGTLFSFNYGPKRPQ